MITECHTMNNHGGARMNAGRKAIAIKDKKSVQIAFRVTVDEKEKLLLCAKKQNCTLSEYIKSKCI